MKARAVLFGLLLIVAGAAAVLSFDALRDLALRCGFSARLAWLLPVVIDAGAASGSLVWLGGRETPAARRFARVLALGLLGLSIAANALAHALTAHQQAPDWRVVVIVSAIAPAVLGAVVHLAVLVGRPEHLDLPQVEPTAEIEPTAEAESDTAEDELGGEFVDADVVSRCWGDAPAVDGVGGAGLDRAEVLIAAGVGRRRLSKELGMSEHQARQLLERHARQRGDSTAGSAVVEGRQPYIEGLEGRL